MGKVQWRSELLTQAGICVSYAAAFLAIHSIAAAHWHLYAGLQVICLLMVPYRYWGALLVGEAIPNAYEAWICLDTFGPTWVAIRSVPEILLTMPVIWWCRERLNVFPTRHLVNVKSLLVCVLLVSIVLSSYSYALISVLHITSGPFRLSPVMAAGYFSGNYVGLLTLVPWALIARMDYRKGRAKTQFSWMFTSRLAPDAFGIVIPLIIVMALVASRMGSAQAQLIEMAMFVPAGWLTAKHGWRAAALAGTAVIVCNALLNPDIPELGVIEIQAALGLAVSCLYALGARVTAQNLRDEREKQKTQGLQRMARQNLAMSERRLRGAAERLDYVAGSLHTANSRVLDYMRRIVPNIETHGFYKQALLAHEEVYRLAESLHPSVWRDRGVPAALNETVARALNEAGIAYSCEIGGRGFFSLEAPVLTGIYRTACEAIVHVASNLTCSRIRLKVRAGQTNQHPWVVIRVDGLLNDNEVANAVYLTDARCQLGSKLGASLVSVDEMRSHAEAFSGELHLRSTADRVTVSALLHSHSAEVRQQKASAPLRLWVN